MICQAKYNNTLRIFKSNILLWTGRRSDIHHVAEAEAKMKKVKDRHKSIKTESPRSCGIFTRKKIKKINMGPRDKKKCWT